MNYGGTNKKKQKTLPGTRGGRKERHEAAGSKVNGLNPPWGILSESRHFDQAHGDTCRRRRMLDIFEKQKHHLIKISTSCNQMYKRDLRGASVMGSLLFRQP